MNPMNNGLSHIKNAVSPLLGIFHRSNHEGTYAATQSVSEIDHFPDFAEFDGTVRGQEYWAAFRHAQFPCMVFDLDTLQIVSATELVEKAFGFASRELENYDLSVLWPSSEFPERLEFLKGTRHLESGQSNGPVLMRGHGGSEFHLRFSFRNVNLDGRRLRMVFYPELVE